jgi:hypothetical protein
VRFGIAALGAMLVVGGCVSSGIGPDAQTEGLTEGLLFELEAESWGAPFFQRSWEDRAREMKVPVDSRAIAIRNITCWTTRGSFQPRIFECDYLVDWGRDGRIEGTVKRKPVFVGRDDDGEWTNELIVVTGS